MAREKVSIGAFYNITENQDNPIKTVGRDSLLSPQTPKNTSFLGSPSLHGSRSPCILGDTSPSLWEGDPLSKDLTLSALRALLFGPSGLAIPVNPPPSPQCCRRIGALYASLYVRSYISTTAQRLLRRATVWPHRYGEKLGGCCAPLR